jgi:hypothetical protein
MRRQPLAPLVQAALVLLLGVWIGVWVKSKSFITFTTDLSLGQLINATVGICLTVLVARAAGQLSDRRKHFVTLVMPTVNETVDQLNAIQAYFEAATVQPMPLKAGHDAVAAFRRAMNSVEHMRQQVEILEFSRDATDLCTALRDSLAYFRDESTRHKVPTDGFRITIAEFNRYQRACNDIRLQLTRIAKEFAL